ncbi:FAD-dependent monooxygenase [Microbacterium sp. zg.Y1090]|uniref:FAD-dependent oxidoreductase n=1 Tax=Microbacterium wangruii TaxID=3049073 RepID=UPI00214D7F61|nr:MULTISPECIES: NAD(P)/FAD-dependent oxidoreductase [unclassified Microbacterium]MCR2819502.1 FAD-dependent monooxygenase [Microbacterium sp. zg.Y1090]WIM28474.1 NAD(P)/FAD-dependent oxidoreductase [Microbacterium sp. zg-Y1090]
MPEVLIVGAGPVGTFLASELARLHVDVTLWDRRPEPGGGTRAIGLHAPVLAALEAGGATERILQDAVRVRRGEARSDGRLLGVVRFDRLNRRHPYVATLPQPQTEAALAVHAPAVRRGVDVTGIRRGPDMVRVQGREADAFLAESASLVVLAGGAGARPLVYRAGAVPTTAYPDRYLMSDATLPPRADAQLAVVHLDEPGVLESFPLPGGRRRFVAWDSDGGDADPTDDAARLARLQTALRRRGEHAGAEAVTAATAFRVRRVVAPQLRRGRVFAIGDTAHEVSPIGGQGMNLGLLDAAGLAPLLMRWLREGAAPEPELARWERDRVRSARWAARLAAANTRLGRPVDATTHAVRTQVMRAALAVGGPLFAHAYAMGFDAAN